MTAPGAFERCRLGELPTFLDGPNGRGSARALGAQQDVEQAVLTDAVLMRYPPRCPPDALDILGASSDLQRFPGEPDGAVIPPSGYHGRLLARWETWKKAGSYAAIPASLNAYGLPDVLALGNPEWPAYDPADPSTWKNGSYSNTHTVLGPGFGTTGIGPQLWGQFNWGDPDMTWGSTATPAQIAQIERQILKWKCATALPVSVILYFGGSFVWGLSEWGDGDTWGDVDGESPCQWLMSNVWGPDMMWGEFNWGNARAWSANGATP